MVAWNGVDWVGGDQEKKEVKVSSKLKIVGFICFISWIG
jgi:hypothetical protein